MALIKCPECGKDVSTQAKACPHCGYPLNKDNISIEENNKECPKPLDESWMEIYKKKPLYGKLILTLIFFVTAIIFTICFIINSKYYFDYLAFYISGGLLLIFAFALWIAGLICLKYKTINCDGYNAIVIAGIWNNTLVIENKVIEKAHNRYFNGAFPNGKKIRAEIAYWDSSIRIILD